jgi:hypothetical protein
LLVLCPWKASEFQNEAKVVCIQCPFHRRVRKITCYLIVEP